MKRIMMLVVAMVFFSTTALFGQQVQGTKPADTAKAAEAAPAKQAVSPAPVRRSYRSYSVSPSTRGQMYSHGVHMNHATWRHADSKATGQFHTGR